MPPPLLLAAVIIVVVIVVAAVAPQSNVCYVVFRSDNGAPKKLKEAKLVHFSSYPIKTG